MRALNGLRTVKLAEYIYALAWNNYSPYYIGDFIGVSAMPHLNMRSSL
jgi:hypothetical protein